MIGLGEYIKNNYQDKSLELEKNFDKLYTENPLFRKIVNSLDVPKDKLLSRMMRDKISFEVENYAYEKELKKMNIEEFIDFCIRNKKYILRTKKESVIQEDEELL